jgi:hypothetical protein
MRYQVPQFIEVESKIFGPLTLKQFIYLAGGAGIIFLLYIILPVWLTFLLGLPVAGFGLALAFYKINNQPFIKVLENALKYSSSGKLYLWKKTQQKLAPKKELEKPAQVFVPKITKSKLKDLAWSLDIQERIK